MDSFGNFIELHAIYNIPFIMQSLYLLNISFYLSIPKFQRLYRWSLGMEN